MPGGVLFRFEAHEPRLESFKGKANFHLYGIAVPRTRKCLRMYSRVIKSPFLELDKTVQNGVRLLKSSLGVYNVSSFLSLKQLCFVFLMLLQVHPHTNSRTHSALASSPTKIIFSRQLRAVAFLRVARVSVVARIRKASESCHWYSFSCMLPRFRVLIAFSKARQTSPGDTSLARLASVTKCCHERFLERGKNAKCLFVGVEHTFSVNATFAALVTVSQKCSAGDLLAFLLKGIYGGGLFFCFLLRLGATLACCLRNTDKEGGRERRPARSWRWTRASQVHDGNTAEWFNPEQSRYASLSRI